MRKSCGRIKPFASWAFVGDNSAVNQPSQQIEIPPIVRTLADKVWTASKKITFHKSARFMDCLHGDVDDDEMRLKCYYEYARESKCLWKVARHRDALINNGWNSERAALRAFEEKTLTEHTPLTRHVLETIQFLVCQSFPQKSWQELSGLERGKIMSRARRKIEPLPVQNVQLHYPKNEFPQFNGLAGHATPVVEIRPGDPLVRAKGTEAIVPKSGSVYYGLFVVHFSDSAKHLTQQFKAWLKSDSVEELRREHRNQREDKLTNPFCARKDLQWHESAYWCLFEVDLSANKGDLTERYGQWLASRKIQTRLKRYKQETRGNSDKWKDRLKDLAAWRLYREHGNKWYKANQFANDNRKKFKSRRANVRGFYKLNDPRPFRGAQQTGDDAANNAPLFSCDDDYRHAKSEAMKFLADFIPNEFKQPPSKLADQLMESLDKISSKKRPVQRR